MTQRKLLIDADLLCHMQTAAAEHPFRWESDLWTLHSDPNEAMASTTQHIERLMKDLEADSVELAWNDLEGGNFRKDLDPLYKGNRADTRKPLAFKEVRDWLMQEFSSWARPGLEGDDVLGILATHPKLAKAEEKIIVSGDKDLLTIPGLHHSPDGLIEVSEEEADYNFLHQTLTGDKTDGYPGCPGIGPKTADAKLAERCDWDKVVAVYESKGLGETEALHQARLARILRASDYDFKAKAPILWSPRSDDE